MHYWRAHPEFMNNGMEVKNLDNGEEFKLLLVTIR